MPYIDGPGGGALSFAVSRVIPPALPTVADAASTRTCCSDGPCAAGRGVGAGVGVGVGAGVGAGVGIVVAVSILRIVGASPVLRDCCMRL